MMFRFICILSMVLLVSSISYAVSDADLVGLWLFEDGDGATVTDSSQYENHGEVEGDPEWVDGKYGGGMLFDGADDMVVVPDADILEFDDDFTLAVWINTEATPPQPPSIITKGYHDQSNTRPWYLLYYRPAGTMTLYLRTLADANSVADGGTAINDGEWHHVVGMKVGDEVKVYIDGAEDASVPLGGEATYGENDYPLVFMTHYNRFLSGVIDEVALFKKALSENEIEELMGGAGDMLAVEPGDKLATSWGQIKHSK